MIHYDTKNDSFLEVSEKLENIGVHNYQFMLQLNNPELNDVDPFGKYKWREIVDEFFHNPWYYLREICRYKDSQLLKLNLGTCAQIYLTLNNVSSWAILPKGSSKMLTDIALLQYFVMIGVLQHPATIIAASDECKKDDQILSHSLYDNLPPYLKVYKYLNGILNFSYQRKSIERNEILMRGATSDITCFFEPERMNYLKYMIDAHNPMYATIKHRALQEDWYCSRIFSGCAPRNENKEAYDYCNKQYHDSCPFTPEMYDMSEETLRDYVKDHSKNNLVTIRYDYKELELYKDPSYQALVEETKTTDTNKYKSLYEMTW